MRLLAMLGERDVQRHPPLSPIPGQRLTAIRSGCTGSRKASSSPRQKTKRSSAPGCGNRRRPRRGGGGRVRPLITRDNDWTVLDRIPNFVVCAEVLRGLGIAPTFTFELAGGGRRDVSSSRSPCRSTSACSAAGGSGHASGRQPLYLRLRNIQYGLTRIDRGRALYVAYNATTDPGLVPRKLIRMSRNRRVRGS